MTKDNMFKATGAAAIAFDATGARIDYGVNAEGRQCGIYGQSQAGFPRATPFAGVGIWGDGLEQGVHGRGAFTNSASVGVIGEGIAAGVQGNCAEGFAILGVSSIGRGGEFRSDRAQIRLQPASVKPFGRRETPDFGTRLPKDGQTGDLLALSQGNTKSQVRMSAWQRRTKPLRR